MKKIFKKVWLEYFEQILSGNKKFELRLADFDVQEGDMLVLQEWDQHKQEYTGRQVSVKVTYVLHTKDLQFWQPLEIEKYGYQVVQFDILTAEKRSAYRPKGRCIARNSSEPEIASFIPRLEKPLGILAK